MDVDVADAEPGSATDDDESACDAGYVPNTAGNAATADRSTTTGHWVKYTRVEENPQLQQSMIQMMPQFVQQFVHRVILSNHFL